MSPAEMVDAGIQALRKTETHELSYEAAAHTAIAWAALAQATVLLQQDEREGRA